VPAKRNPFSYDKVALPNARLYLDDLEELVQILSGDDASAVEISNSDFSFDSVRDFEGWDSRKVYSLTLERREEPRVGVVIYSFRRAEVRVRSDTLAAKTLSMVVTELFKRRRSFLRTYGYYVLAALVVFWLTLWTLANVVTEGTGRDVINWLGLVMLPTLPLMIYLGWSGAIQWRTVIVTKTRADAPTWWSQNWRNAIWDVTLSAVSVGVGYILGSRHH